jgi:serine protease AprX
MMTKKRPVQTQEKPRARHAAVTLAIIVAAVLGLRGSSAGHRAQLSVDLLAHEALQTESSARVIVHGTPSEIGAIAAKHHLGILSVLDGMAVLSANSRQLTSMAADPAIDHLSGDLPVHPSMAVSNASTGATQVRSGTYGILGLIGAIPAVTGQGVVVAVVDSGISPHAALQNRVIANVSLVTGDPSVADAFGHGTHVAGIIAGNGAAAIGVTNLYTGGIAPGARLVNVRVLGANGSGLTSDVIAGINWVIANRARYNIRVINLSLGHPVTEPAATDPLCGAVTRAVQAGLVVIASAGNAGKNAEGQTVLGGIMSPGNSPNAITVGALNTWGTVSRNDDTVTTYSSRGPTRFDLAVKPDVVAPGNKIVSLEASGSYLSTTYPFLYRAGYVNNSYMQLSGTSMAAPMVSGAVALLLQGNPSLSPAQVKLSMQSGATFMPDGGLMGGGAGSVNFWATRQTTGATGVTALLQGLVGLLAPPSGASFWDAGTMSGRLYRGTGIRLLSAADGAAASANPSLLAWGTLNLVGLGNPLANVPANHLLWGQVAGWTTSNQIIWGDAIYDPQGQQIIWGDSSTTQDNQIIWGDAILTSPDPR